MRNRTAGVVTGYVKEVDATQSRVKLEFPFLQESYRSDWAPIAAGMSGKKRGMYFMPEVDDEVLVAFENGDFDRPYVIGFLWNGVDVSPETDVNNRVILTPGGHTLRFEDTKGSKKIIVKSDAGHHVTIDDAARTVTVCDSMGANQIVIDSAGGTIKIQATAKIAVSAPQVELTGSAVHPVVLGDLLQTFIDTMVTPLLKSHTHLVLGVIPAVASVELQALPPYMPTINSMKVMTG
jgi:uncharacterized protein involved in type VI secretion and phage assembly